MPATLPPRDCRDHNLIARSVTEPHGQTERSLDAVEQRCRFRAEPHSKSRRELHEPSPLTIPDSGPARDQVARDVTAPPILPNGAELFARYDVLFSDVWGVVHDGVTALPGATEALRAFRRKGGTVVLVSNAPVPNFRVAEMLDGKLLPRDAWDAIVTSGDIALAHVDAAGYQALHWIGPVDRDAALFERVPGPSVALDKADAILCSGLDDDINETAESYRGRLEHALARRLPFVCANPDFVVDVGGRHYLCAGAIADVYEAMGGDVFWAGKPHASAYRAAHEAAERIRAGAIDHHRILVIGDSIRTDLTGARLFGVDALFIASGIHRPVLMQGDDIDPAKLALLFEPEGTPPAVAAQSFLRW
ncbi:MAG: TIGR01459 family HAD-type hydrolase [Hyphomicrobiaceae bacterium]|nr:TIGR01459 family HAD-type hydrolase [Hyphomicrobiaceae bacterium]